MSATLAAVKRTEQKLVLMSQDLDTMKKQLKDAGIKMSSLLPEVEVIYRPMTYNNWKKLVKTANARCKYTASGKIPVTPENIDQVALRLQDENQHGLPLFKNKHGQWQTAELESDLYHGEYTYSYIAPRLLNQGLVIANTDFMLKTPSGKYMARIKINHTQLHLGLYNTREIATEAYRAAKQEYLCILADHFCEYLPSSVTYDLKSYMV